MLYFAFKQRMKYELYTFFTLISLFSVSCRKNTIEIVADSSSSYFPMEVGHTWVYKMDSIHYYGGGLPVDTFHYQTQHSIVEKFIDNSGNTAYRVEISYRKDSVSPWKFSRNYQLKRENNNIIRIDFDITEVVAKLPVTNEKVWDGNELNALGNSDFFYLNAHETAAYGGMAYDSTVSIHQEERMNLIENFTGLEVYASHTGLIYREKYALKDIHDPQKTSGYIYHYTLVSFEK